MVVNNAGFGAFGEDARIDEATLTGMLQLNVFALTLLTHRAALSFGRKEGGQILNVASTAAFQACPYLAAYAATKSYVLSYSRARDEELRGSGVRVKCLCPGPTRILPVQPGLVKRAALTSLPPMSTKWPTPLSRF